ncbi:RagB/SusD family nutrient uptake outer membrane protein [Chitinophaga sp. sic0106]|uniref:RagB/SusD family nutrient uptake outer membrane protein n=1 Tax=Chitinophaga sp. sic0106 TaxID=2854785 RepID=UPI001C45DA49|nr:RagB/SusD family nutrient uptake outer membrane protein [Chitinophaga sp. sic0106]MBV7529142.1 RagB/SusD family nutrient uptake outer membrane protein [Chitinophaga sp. sic0106]
MRKYTLLLPVLACIGFAACQKDVIEKEPLEFIDDDLVFDKLDSLGVYAERYLYNVYADLPSGFNRVSSHILDAGTDDAVPNNATATVQYFSNGQWTPYNLPDNRWTQNYNIIQKVNLFLSKINQVPLKTAGLKEQWIAEARLMRAWAYFELTKRWGGVPLIGDQVFDINSDISYARNSYTDCVSYIVKEADTARKYLPAAYATAYYGRLTSGAAMALKSRVLLYAASELNNPDHNTEKWQAAAQAAKDVMDTKVYSLPTAFDDVYLKRKNSEIIVAYMTGQGYTVEMLNGPVGSKRGDGGATNPTQELVDEFEMANGKMITEAGSGYDAAKPYTGRDPRFYYTVFHNGMSWLGRTVETFDGGIDRALGFGNTVSGETRTGYYMRKFLTTAGTASSYTSADHCFPIIRYAEILLNYAEALNEASGPVKEVYDALHLIRQRAKLNPYTLPAGLNKEQMRERIRHERRIEMAFEEQRFWDIRRWKMADKVLNGSLHGVQITKAQDGSLTYKKVEVTPTKFLADRMYLYPIPYQEMISNGKMDQNPNW